MTPGAVVHDEGKVFMNWVSKKFFLIMKIVVIVMGTDGNGKVLKSLESFILDVQVLIKKYNSIF